MPSLLFVDDELLYRQLYGTAFEKAGYQVRYAANGEEALAAIKSERPDLLIVDCVMPIMTGMTLLKKIRRRKIPTFVLTTLEGDTDREDALALGAKGFFSKSDIDPETLLKKIQTLSTPT